MFFIVRSAGRLIRFQDRTWELDAGRNSEKCSSAFETKFRVGRTWVLGRLKASPEHRLIRPAWRLIIAANAGWFCILHQTGNESLIEEELRSLFRFAAIDKSAAGLMVALAQGLLREGSFTPVYRPYHAARSYITIRIFSILAFDIS